MKVVKGQLKKKLQDYKQRLENAIQLETKTSQVQFNRLVVRLLGVGYRELQGAVVLRLHHNINDTQNINFIIKRYLNSNA